MTAAARLVTLAVAIAASPACLVVSTSPLYDDHSLEYEEALVGQWADADGQVRLDVARGEWRSYRVTWHEGAEAAHATAHLTRVAGTLFLDVMPVAGEEREPLLLAVHAFGRVRLDGDTLVIEPLDYEHLSAPGRRALLPAGRRILDERGNLLLSVPTRELREWVARHHRTPGLFGDPVELTRSRPQSVARVPTSIGEGHQQRVQARTERPFPELP